VTFGAIFLLAVGLSMDAAAVSAARGLATERILGRHVLRVALFFGGFQALMPLAGWFIGDQVGPWVAAWDHWIAFFLLGMIGGKMLWEARGGDEEEETPASDEALFGSRVMLVLAIATSVDAFAVGVTLPILSAPLLLSIVTIGVTTAVLSALALYFGRRLGAMFGRRLDMVGGLVLIGLGIKILIEHLSA
jgi:putative Mn2+ efflux pump MntP